MLVSSTSGAGTICLRSLALGARTPWYRIRLSRWRRHQDAEFFYQFQWRQDEKGRTVRPGGFEAKGEVLVIDDLQTSGGQGRSDDVAVQPFQTGPIGGVDAGGGME